MVGRIYNAVIDSLAVVHALVLITLFWLGVVVVLHWEGFISAEPVMVVLNHVIDGALEDFFYWLLEDVG